MKTSVVFIVVLALIAATALAANDSKVNRKKASAGLTHHLSKLLATIGKESKAGHVKFGKFVKSCKTKLSEHSKKMTQAKKTIAKDLLKVQSNKAEYRKVLDEVIPAFEKEAQELEKKKEELGTKMVDGDRARKEAYAKYAKARKEYTRHLAFVRKLYLFIMGSKVEKRRTVLLQEKAKEVTAHAETMTQDSAAQVMMEQAATMLSQNHLDALYKLLDNLRNEIQRDRRSAKRKELRAANAWVLEHSELRAKQLRYHNKQLKASLNASKAEMKNAKLDWDTEKQQRECDTLSLRLDHHKRDKDLLALSCRRTVMYYKRRFKDWKDEKAALTKVQAKVDNFYGKSKKSKKKSKKKRR